MGRCLACTTMGIHDQRFKLCQVPFMLHPLSSKIFPFFAFQSLQPSYEKLSKGVSSKCWVITEITGTWEGLKKSPGFEASLIVLVGLSQFSDTITLPISLNAFKITLQPHNLSYDKHAWRWKHLKVLTDTGQSKQKKISVLCIICFYLSIFSYAIGFSYTWLR